ncbi:MAG: branched-chain amino acid transport system substrate-binding protein, partial [Paracoccaceae bacterium]
MFKKIVTGTVALAIATTVQVGAVSAEGTHYIPSLSYRTGPYAGGGTPVANGFADYFHMLNERDGGIGGIKVEVEECETGYNTQKGVECYEATKVKNALVY